LLQGATTASVLVLVYCSFQSLQHETLIHDNLDFCNKPMCKNSVQLTVTDPLIA